MGNFETPVVSWVSPENLQRFRLFSIIALLPMMVVPIYLNDLTYLYRYLTQWSIEIATISTRLPYFAARKPDHSKLNRIALISLEITIFVSIGTMIAFWSSFPNIYFCCIEAYWIFSLSISHIIPQLIVLANLFLSDIKINVKEGLFGVIVIVAYLITDYLTTQSPSAPDTYEFLQWGTIDAIEISGFFIIGTYVFYIVIWKINEAFKNEIDIHLKELEGT